MSKNCLIKNVTVLSLLVICAVQGMDVDVMGQLAQDPQSFMSVLPKDVIGYLSPYADDTQKAIDFIHTSRVYESLLLNKEFAQLKFDNNMNVVAHEFKVKFPKEMSEINTKVSGFLGGKPVYLPDAARHSNTALVKLLVHEGADINKSDALSAAVVARNHKLLEYLLKQPGVKPDGFVTKLSEKEDQTALDLAAEYDDLESVKLLLKEGANPNIGGRAGTTTPLSSAVCNTNLTMAETLLKAGAKPNIQVDIWWISPFKEALEMGNEQMIELLKRYGGKETKE